MNYKDIISKFWLYTLGAQILPVRIEMIHLSMYILYDQSKKN